LCSFDVAGTIKGKRRLFVAHCQEHLQTFGGIMIVIDDQDPQLLADVVRTLGAARR
jgi:hypothetical protein